MAIVSKSEKDDKEHLHSNFFWPDDKEIFSYSIFFSKEECYPTYQLT
jgi:hypothetical protein